MQEYIYRPQRSYGKVMFLHLSVILSMEGVWQTPPLSKHPRGQTPLLGKHLPGQTPPPPGRRLLQRTVRILLECILVTFCERGSDLFFDQCYQSK